jgi:hypothetical protein
VGKFHLSSSTLTLKNEYSFLYAFKHIIGSEEVYRIMLKLKTPNETFPQLAVIDYISNDKV